MPLLLILSMTAFVSAFSIRMIDPLVPAIARDFALPIETAAMLASAYTLPYALAQPILGPLGDALGKARIMKVCLGLLVASLIGGAFATSFEMLFAARMIAGIGGGGIIPIAFAMIGDRFPDAERQVALSRLVMASQVAILLGSAAGGIVAVNYGWRLMFWVPSVISAVMLGVMLVSLKPRAGAVRQPVSLAGMRRAYAYVLANPLAKLCLTGVFVEGVAMFGLMPFIAGRLEARGLGGLTEAGLVIGAMSIGGILFTFAVRRLLERFGRARLIRWGGVICIAGFAALSVSPTWWAEAAIFFVIGAGFFMMHNSLQALGVELAPDARASGVATFAFVFFMGQAVGPLVYRIAFSAFGYSLPILVGGIALAAVALWISASLERLAASASTHG